MSQQVFISCSVLLCSAVIYVLLLCFSFGAHFLFFSVNVTSAKKCLEVKPTTQYFLKHFVCSCNKHYSHMPLGKIIILLIINNISFPYRIHICMLLNNK